MEISYENNLDDWVAAELFNLDQLTSLTKHDRKTHIVLLICFIITGIFIYLLSEKEAMFNVLVFFLIFSVVFFFLLNKKNRQKWIYKRLRIAYGQPINRWKDKLVRWQATPEQLVIRNFEKEIRIPWSSVQKVTLCRQYLFVHYGAVDFAAVPKQRVCEGEYDVFTRHFVTCYQDYANQQNTQSTVIQSDWMIDIDRLKGRISWKLSVRRLGFVLLWWLIFLLGGILLFFALIFGIMIVGTISGFELGGEDKFSSILAKMLLIGSALTGLLGLILGLFGKLPGTKIKKN